MRKKTGIRMAVIGVSIFITGIVFNGFNVFHDMNVEKTGKHIIKAMEEVTTETVDGIEWSYKNGFDRATDVSPVNKDSLPDKVVIPERLGGLPVYSVGSYAFSETKVSSVVVPDTVSLVGSFAFADCPNLVTLRLPQKALYIWEGAFKNCKAITEISALGVYKSAFEGCTSLKTVNISVDEFSTFFQIGSNAFKGCTFLQEVRVSDSIKTLGIGANAFEDCASLKNFNTNCAVEVDKFAFLGCKGLSNIVFKDSMSGKAGAFKDCTALTSLTFEGSTKLAYGTFWGCTSLENVTFNGEVIDMFYSNASSVFEGCTALKKVIFNGESAYIVFGKNDAMEEIVYNNTKVISGGINGVNTLKKLVFNTKNPDLSRFSYSGSSNLNIEGYREKGINAELPGHDTAYQWAKENNISSYTSLGTFDEEKKTETPSAIAEQPIGQVYYVNFDGNGGVVNGIITRFQQEVIYNKTFGTLKTATRKGYTFKGWYTQKTGGEKITEDTKVMMEPNTTFYAQWDKVSVAQGGITKLSNSKSKKLTIVMKKISRIEGYEILYSNSNNFEDINQKIVSASKTSCTISKLTKGQTYYVKVRAYKVDSAGNKIYGKYSPVKQIKIKR